MFGRDKDDLQGTSQVDVPGSQPFGNAQQGVAAPNDGQLPQPGFDTPQQSDGIPGSAPTLDTDTPGDYIMTDAPTSPAPSQEYAQDNGTQEYNQAPVDTTPIEVASPDYSQEEQTPIPVHTASPAGDDLSSIKQAALQQLSPLVGHLDQSPEEKFHTTMMMLQATDDQSLVKVAYESAQSIADEKTRAQALLDVVNEINYFTQKKS